MEDDDLGGEEKGGVSWRKHWGAGLGVKRETIFMSIKWLFSH